LSRPVIRNSSGQINVTFPLETNYSPSYTVANVRHHSYDNQKHIALDKVMKQLNRLVGLKNVKDFVYEIYAWLYITQCRKEIGLKASLTRPWI
jgi:stage V sporulation protein K